MTWWYSPVIFVNETSVGSRTNCVSIAENNHEFNNIVFDEEFVLYTIMGIVVERWSVCYRYVPMKIAYRLKERCSHRWWSNEGRQRDESWHGKTRHFPNESWMRCTKFNQHTKGAICKFHVLVFHLIHRLPSSLIIELSTAHIIRSKLFFFLFKSHTSFCFQFLCLLVWFLLKVQSDYFIGADRLLLVGMDVHIRCHLQ